MIISSSNHSTDGKSESLPTCIEITLVEGSFRGKEIGNQVSHGEDFIASMLKYAPARAGGPYKLDRDFIDIL